MLLNHQILCELRARAPLSPREWSKPFMKHLPSWSDTSHLTSLSTLGNIIQHEIYGDTQTTSGGFVSGSLVMFQWRCWFELQSSAALPKAGGSDSKLLRSCFQRASVCCHVGFSVGLITTRHLTFLRLEDLRDTERERERPHVFYGLVSKSHTATFTLYSLQASH